MKYYTSGVSAHSPLEYQLRESPMGEPQPSFGSGVRPLPERPDSPVRARPEITQAGGPRSSTVRSQHASRPMARSSTDQRSTSEPMRSIPHTSLPIVEHFQRRYTASVPQARSAHPGDTFGLAHVDSLGTMNHLPPVFEAHVTGTGLTQRDAFRAASMRCVKRLGF
ncbi:hypothetical protein CALCODRAFT_184893 [Calocera cornea HHB12733]|uniref:Uncharacterized protein n=1 Tax=Calocera cornea HHB12733 TaxID=1353952 RepID=A0A165C9Y2_9BASI|nr:hypothetical protein CALCODRAFT_184893 [Calocera cornea HHB12733]